MCSELFYFRKVTIHQWIFKNVYKMVNNFHGFQKFWISRGTSSHSQGKQTQHYFWQFFLRRENLQVAIHSFHCLRTWRKATGKKFHCCYGLIFVQNRNILGLVQTPNFSWAEPLSNQGRPKLFRPAELIQTPTLIPAELNSKEEKHSFRSTTYKRRYNNLCIWFGTWKVRRLNQSPNSLPG